MAEVPSIWQWPREAGDVRVLGCQSASLFGLSRSRTRPALPPCDRVWLQISLSGCRSSLRDRLPVGGRLQDAGSELHAEQQLFAASPGCSQAGSLQADQRRASPGISQAVGEAPVRGGPRDGLCRLLLRGAQECGYGLSHPLRRRLDLAISQMGRNAAWTAHRNDQAGGRPPAPARRSSLRGWHGYGADREGERPRCPPRAGHNTRKGRLRLRGRSGSLGEGKTKGLPPFGRRWRMCRAWVLRGTILGPVLPSARTSLSRSTSDQRSRRISLLRHPVRSSSRMISACSRLLLRVCLSRTRWSRAISSRDRKRVSACLRFLFTASAGFVSM